MSFSTGRMCEATKQFILNSSLVISSQLKGEIVMLDTLTEEIQSKLAFVGCDWPIFIKKEESIHLYFSCCCTKGSVVVLKVQSPYPDVFIKSLVEYLSGYNTKIA